MEIELAVNGYLNELTLNNYSASTLKSTAYHFKIFTHYLKQAGIVDTLQIEKKYLNGFIDHIKRQKSQNTGKPLADTTIFSRIGNVRLFLEYCVRNEYMYTDFASVFSGMRYKKKKLPHNVLSEQAIKKVLCAPDEGSYFGFRDKVIFELFYNTGIRRSELAHLDLYDINFEEHTIFIRQGKGKKDRLVPMGSYLEKYLKEYIQKVRPVLVSKIDETRLFVNNTGRAINPGNLNTLTLRYCNRIAIQFTCHTFRHSFATHMLKHGAGILYIQQILGHSDPSSTEVYTKVYPKDLKDVIDNFHPRSTRKLAEEKISMPTKWKNTQIEHYKKKLKEKNILSG